MNYKALESFLIPEVALEADDITKQVNQIMGGKDAPAENRTEDQREEDLTQTDNLFDDINEDASDNNPIDNHQNTDNNNNEDASNNDADTDADTDNPEDTDNPDNQISDEDSMSDNPNNEESGMNEADKSIFSDKNTLKENMIYFFNIIRYTITSLEDSLGSTEDQETIRVINSVVHNLYGAKDILYKILTEQMEQTPYETLTAKYITLKRIYDISCDMLEEHFTNNPNTKVKYKRFRNKTK